MVVAAVDEEEDEKGGEEQEQAGDEEDPAVEAPPSGRANAPADDPANADALAFGGEPRSPAGP